MTEWQPIEDIPRDKSILVFLEDGQMAVVKWETDIERWSTKGWEECYYCRGGSQADIVENKFNDVKMIIKWMPLPNPPKKKHNCRTVGAVVYRDDKGTMRWCSGFKTEVVNFCPYCGEKA